MPRRQIYLLSPRELSPETIAVAFAKTSRSPESFRETASDLSAEQSARFHEKWVVGYGHASVAEHAVLHLAIENVSRLAVETIESNRLASYTEKSTRYQKWGSNDFFFPPELKGSRLAEPFKQTCRRLFDTYKESLAQTRRLIQKQSPPHQGEAGEAYDRRIRSQYVDSCRFLLPAASLANLGMTVNARVLENAIRKMLSHPLVEVRLIGRQVKRVAQAEVPTLVKYAEVVPYLTETGQAVKVKVQAELEGAGRDWCLLVDFDPDGESRVLAAALYRFGHMPFAQALEMVHSFSEPQSAQLAEALFKHMGRHDIPLRELEHAAYTFDLILDQGAYAEFKRHRMMTQTPQALTARLGYALPRQIAEAGLEGKYRSAMEAAAETYEKLADWNPQVAAYVVPNGFNRRVLFTLNLREAYVFCQLRSAANAHYSIRRVALRLGEEIRRVHPRLANFMHLPEETWQEIEIRYFTQT